MFEKIMVRGFSLAALVASAATAQAASVFNMPSGETSLQLVTVGNPGNAADPSTGYGAVSYTYQMGTYDVTVAQYCQFLNAVATTGDPYGLYNSGMATGLPTIAITQNGSAPNYSYTVTGSDSQGVNCPIFDVTWGDAARFCNWLQNGQPTSGAEATNTTETGAYTLSGATSDAALMAVDRNANATYFIPSENEWYKAAYFDPTLNGGAGGYWTYPTKSNTAPINILSPTGTNNANSYGSLGNGGCTDPTNYLTPVGSFVLSPGPFGTYDMGGDVLQWNEGVRFTDAREAPGGAWGFYSGGLASEDSLNDFAFVPTYQIDYIGFRVASSAAVPEPGGIALLLAGAMAFGIWRLRRNA